MHGYTVEELQSMSVLELDVPESAKLVASRMRQVQEGGKLIFEVAHYRKDGTIFPLEVSTAIVEIGGEKRVLSFDRDITERNWPRVICGVAKNVSANWSRALLTASMNWIPMVASCR